MILVRFFLISLIAYLIVRSFVKFGQDDKSGQGTGHSERDGEASSKKVSKSIGEYVDYEEIKEKKS
jgi:hypothetical protein